MPFNAKQQEYLRNATHRWNVKTGATASGKTFIDYAFVIPRCIDRCVGEGLIVLIGNNINSIERNVLSPMREIWPGFVSPIRQGNNTATIFGKKCFVMGADKINQAARIQGTTIEFAYGDEVTTWNEGFFEMLKSRLRAPGSCFHGTCNPAGPNHWFKKFLDSDVDVYHQHYILDDNKDFLPPGTVENLKREHSGVWYRRYINGEWCLAEGLIYPNFDHKAHAADRIPSLRNISISMDVGQSNATVFLATGEGDDNRLYCLKEYYHSGGETGMTKSPLSYAKDFEKWLDALLEEYPGIQIDDIWVDPSALGFIAQLRELGFIVRRAKNDVLPGIQAVSSLIDADLLRVHKRCTHLLDELMAYAWDSKAAERGEDKPIKESDHVCDALRYRIFSTKYDWVGRRPKEIER